MDIMNLGLASGIVFAWMLGFTYLFMRGTLPKGGKSLLVLAALLVWVIGGLYPLAWSGDQVGNYFGGGVAAAAFFAAIAIAGLIAGCFLGTWSYQRIRR